MNPWWQLAVLAVFMLVVMSAGWLWQRKHLNAGIVDVLWSSGLGAGAVMIAATGSGETLPRVLLAVLGGAWALRLAWHIWQRVQGEPEDGRYRYLRAHWRGSQLKFYGLFVFQAGLVVLFALPFVAVASNRDATVTPMLALGILIWIVAVAGETIADRQLARFRSHRANKAETCRVGLWRYSRHPNYFFEWIHWFAYVALAIGSPIAWLAWSGPVIMVVFLRWISGIPFVEAQALRTRGEDYREYQRTTSMLIPWFPKISRVRRRE